MIEDGHSVEANAAAFWDGVRAQLEAGSAGARVVVELGAPAPGAAGARRDLGLPVGQLADWRFPPGADCTGLHVHEHADRYEAHLDQVHPACGLVEHVRADAPQLLVVGGALVGTWIALGGGAGRAIAGLLLGAAVGAVFTRQAATGR
jgi:hypothetical protein